MADNQNYMSHIWTKGFSNLNFNHAVIDKILDFQKQNLPNFTYRYVFTKLVILKYKTNCFTYILWQRHVGNIIVSLLQRWVIFSIFSVGSTIATTQLLGKLLVNFNRTVG